MKAINFINQQLLRGIKVVIIAHGEGTNFAEHVYAGLTADQKAKVGVVYVGPTAGSLPSGHSSYILNS